MAKKPRVVQMNSDHYDEARRIREDIGTVGFYDTGRKFFDALLPASKEFIALAGKPRHLPQPPYIDSAH